MNGETPKTYIEHLLASALSDLQMTSHLSSVDISVPDPQFGDYSTNAALILAKKLKQNPHDVAQTIIKAIEKIELEGKIELMEAAAGFINFKLSKNYVAACVYPLAASIEISKAGTDNSGKPKKVLFEYSSPNTNKPLHIGHTRNDVYGMACVNLLKAVGYNVVSCEVINDRGIHIMKSMLMYRKYGSGKTPQSEAVKPDHFVGRFYTMFAEKAAESPEKEKELLNEAQALLVKWEAGDDETRKLWRQMNEWWYEGVKQTYAAEGSQFDEVDYESEIYGQGRDLVLEGVKKGVFIKEEDGSVSVDLTGKGLDKKYLLRKDGTTIYITQDLYLWYLRNQKHRSDLAIVTTSAEQSYHFRVLKNLFELLGFPWAENFRHLPYEHVFLGHDKMSSRSGNTISADELLVLIKDKVKNAMAGLEKIKESSDNDNLVEQVALGAIKYGYLKYEPNTRIYFEPDQTIALEGNTGPYIQYAHARIQSIIKKAGVFDKMQPVALIEPAEIALMKKLLHYTERIVPLAAAEFKPNLLCNYLYELASTFNAFYSSVPVLASGDITLKNQRLTLLTATAGVLSHGLGILGIGAPEEM